MSPFHRHVDGTGREIGGRWEGWRVDGGGEAYRRRNNKKRKKARTTRNEERAATGYILKSLEKYTAYAQILSN